MKSKQEAELKLATLVLLVPVVVEDAGVDADNGRARLRFVFSNPNGRGTKRLEIYTDPSVDQLEDLARNLPVDELHREDTRRRLLES